MTFIMWLVMMADWEVKVSREVKYALDTIKYYKSEIAYKIMIGVKIDIEDYESNTLRDNYRYVYRLAWRYFDETSRERWAFGTYDKYNVPYLERETYLDELWEIYGNACDDYKEFSNGYGSKEALEV